MFWESISFYIDPFSRDKKKEEEDKLDEGRRKPKQPPSTFCWKHWFTAIPVERRNAEISKRFAHRTSFLLDSTVKKVEKQLSDLWSKLFR